MSKTFILQSAVPHRCIAEVGEANRGESVFELLLVNSSVSVLVRNFEQLLHIFVGVNKEGAG
jgi:hypothetical protein